ncbi:hypothetical protein E3Q10_03463 [Wallemia mellicola]|uniref:NAD(+) diphosphatase n=1 Tax=Wallemia mellicola TaxID=1708541 RepID=A0A4T0N8I7_9BASI|nr:hypothetical protein E3Q19_01715 [Wallemia mellicola]TIC27902.1 hypothetical protein E3Q10_03463 [Wallemia mellicola]TIC28075.1 hypothetical protein E3Q11_02026 [Wallemia mellicola]
MEGGLNKISWLRNNNNFLNSVLKKSQFIPLHNLNPLITNNKLTSLPFDDAKSYIGESNYGESMTNIKGSFLEGYRQSNTLIVLLGVKESVEQKANDPQYAPSGTVYFCFDATPFPKEKFESATTKFREARSLIGVLDSEDSKIFAQARSIVDWNLRHKYDSGSGKLNYSCWAGWKLCCSSVFENQDAISESWKGIQNYHYPRTDPVVIMAVLSPDKQQILLGRNKRYASGMYSCLAGFVEVGETFEEAVAREVWEESCTKVKDVQYFASQPWPYPSSLMTGFYAIADDKTDYKKFRTDLDPELEGALLTPATEARWFTREEATEMAKNSPSSLGDKPSENVLFIPNRHAIAGELIRNWLNGFEKKSAI